MNDFYAVGLDVGGTKIAGGLVRFPDGVVVERRRIATGAERGPDAVLADAVALARELAHHVPAGERFVGVGLGVPELVDLSGRITSAHTIDWRGVPLTERFADVGPVWVESDVRAAAVAEARFGAGRAYRIIAYVTVGTGISSTLVIDGHPYAGARGNALILASSPTSVICPECGVWVRPILEEFASGPALAKHGDPRAAGEALGSGVGWLVNVLDPDAVIVGGGLGLAGGLYWEAFVESARRHIWAAATRELPIVMAELGADAGVVGAAARSG